MKTVKWIDPIPGTMICLTDEKLARGEDRIACVVDAPVGCRVSVNGIPCRWENGYYRADVPFSGKRTVLTAMNETYAETAESEVFRLYTPKKIYRVSVDDNIWFLQDIARHQDVYKSIFENPYLALYQRLHEEYGSKFHFNIYYSCPERGGFSLPGKNIKKGLLRNSMFLTAPFLLPEERSPGKINSARREFLKCTKRIEKNK